MSGLDHCVVVGRSPLPAARQKAYAGRRANTIAAETCDCCERPVHSCRRQNDPNHHHQRGRHIGHPRFASGSGCSCEEQPRKAHSAEVITFTVTSCDTPTNNSGLTASSSTPDIADVPADASPPPTPPPSKPERPIDFSPRLEPRTAECSL